MPSLRSTVRPTPLRGAAMLAMTLAMTLAISLALTACGFALRGSSGQYSMPFASIHLGFPEMSPLGALLSRNLRGVGTLEVVADPALAEARLLVLAESRGKSILSLNSQGRVREYLLSYRFVFSLRDASGALLLAPTEINLKRSLTFDETQVLAKESEEALLYRDMQADLVQQIMRRLAALKPA